MSLQMQDALLMHWLILIDFMEKHPSVVTGKFKGVSGKVQYRTLWTELAGLLNAAGCGQRTVEKWQKAWIDFKYHLKKKHSGLLEDYKATGGGLPTTVPLSELEQRVLTLLGTTFYQGINSKERGCNFIREDTIDQTDLGTSKNSDKHFSIAVEENNVTERKNIDEEHTYSSLPSNIRRLSRKPLPEQNYESLYKETSTYLKSIDETLVRELPLIRDCINRVADALKK